MNLNYDFNIPTSQIGFRNNLNFVLAISKQLFNNRFGPYNNSDVFLNKQFNLIIQHNKHSKVFERDLELAKIFMMFDQLLLIKHQNEEAFSKFRSKLRNAKRQDEYLGVRSEIGVASILAKKEVVFKKHEAPDFKINFAKEEIYFEVTSVHLAVKSEKDVFLKLRNAIGMKEGKSYANAKTVLFIDYTNLLFNNMPSYQLLEYNKLFAEFNESPNSRTFGCVIFTFTHYTENDLKMSYIRIDKATIDNNLKNFLDSILPFDKTELFQANPDLSLFPKLP